MTILGGTTAGTGGPFLGLAGASANGMNLRDSHTIMCRIRHNSTATNYDSWIMALQNGGAAVDSGAGSFIGRSNGDAAGNLEAYRFNGSFSFNAVQVAGGYGNTTDWRHLAIVYDNPDTDLDTYVNGAFVSTVNSTTTFVTSTTNLRIILAQHPGSICDVAYFSRALSVAEIAYCAARRDAPRDVPDCFAWYPMIGDTLAECCKDWSGHGNTLSLQQSGSGNPAYQADSVPVPWLSRSKRIWVPLSTPVNFSGTARSTTASTGTLLKKPTFAGTARSGSGSTGTLQVRKVFTSAPSISPTASVGTLQSRRVFSGACESTTACQGTLQSRPVFDANSCSSTTACTGTMTLLGIKAFSGSATSPTACTATLAVHKSSSGACASPSSCTGTLRVRKSYSGSSSSPSACTATLNVWKFVATARAASPTASRGTLTGGTVLLPPNPEDPRNTQKRRSMAIGLYRRRGRH